jgi:hypothetical protein
MVGSQETHIFSEPLVIQLGMVAIESTNASVKPLRCDLKVAVAQVRACRILSVNSGVNE